MTETTKSPASPSLQFLMFTTLTIGIVLLGYLLGYALISLLYGTKAMDQILVLDLSNPNLPNALWLLQIVSTTVPILLSSLIFARFIVKDVNGYLQPTLRVSWLLWVFVLFVMLTASPVIECLTDINQKMQLPQFLNGLQQWMRRSEDQAQQLTQVLLKMTTFGGLLFRLLLIGLLTSIVEEFMFRGCIQQIFIKWTQNPHAAIWITAALFSAFHMEFFGFLPRMALGILFGYFVHYSGSIWTAVWGHFINNGTAVVVTYLYQNKKISINPDDTHIFNWQSYLFSLIIVLFLLYLYRAIAIGKKHSLQL